MNLVYFKQIMILPKLGAFLYKIGSLLLVNEGKNRYRESQISKSGTQQYQKIEDQGTVPKATPYIM